MARNVNEGRLHFTSDLKATLKSADVVFITVGTPPRKDGSADTSQIYAVAKTVAQNLDGYTLVVQKSTAPVGTARDLQRLDAQVREARRAVRRGVEPGVPARGLGDRERSCVPTAS